MTKSPTRHMIWAEPEARACWIHRVQKPAPALVHSRQAINIILWSGWTFFCKDLRNNPVERISWGIIKIRLKYLRPIREAENSWPRVPNCLKRNHCNAGIVAQQADPPPTSATTLSVFQLLHLWSSSLLMAWEHSGEAHLSPLPALTPEGQELGLTVHRCQEVCSSRWYKDSSILWGIPWKEQDTIKWEQGILYVRGCLLHWGPGRK